MLTAKKLGAAVTAFPVSNAMLAVALNSFNF